jgi:hypothetical protein
MIAELEASKAKELEKEKLTIMKPIINSLCLKNSDVDALLLLSKKQLKALAKKLETRLNKKSHKETTTIIKDPVKTANLLWAIAKSACSPGTKLIPNKRYTVNLMGIQILGCFSMAKSLYALADPISTSFTSTVKEGT